MTASQSAPFVEHIRSLRSALHCATGLPTQGTPPITGTPTLVVSVGAPSLTPCEAPDPVVGQKEPPRVTVDWPVSVLLTSYGLTSEEDPEADAEDPFLDEAAAAVLAVAVALRKRLRTGTGAVLREARNQSAGLIPPGEGAPDGVSGYAAEWTATLSFTAALPPAPAGADPDLPAVGLPLDVHL